MSDPRQAQTVEPIAPPKDLIGTLKRIGPGIIITGSIVGSGELIVTTHLGAQAGFTLLWLILFSCFIKVFLQIELGRYVVSSGRSALEAFSLIPGPRVTLGSRFSINWLNALWSIMALCSVFQLSGILLGLVKVFEIPALGSLNEIPQWVWFIAITLITTGLLVSGRYIFVEKTTTFMVFIFSGVTLLSVIMLQWTQDYAIKASDISEGLSFKIPEAGIMTAFAALGITGVGASELIYYPYWCLEKGYAKFTGPNDGSVEWQERATGWMKVLKTDAWISFVIYTVGTVAFYLLGAAVLNRQGLVPDTGDMHTVLSNLYTSTFGEASGNWLYLIGAFAVLFSTFFVATASNCRLFTDALGVFKIFHYRDDKDRLRVLQALCFITPLFCWATVMVYGEPVHLIILGGVAQASVLPFLAFATVYLRYKKTDRSIAPESFKDFFLWLAFISMIIVGCYQLYSQYQKNIAPLFDKTQVEQTEEESSSPK